MNSYIRQLTDLDPECHSFRYMHSKQGAPSFAFAAHQPAAFRGMIERLADYLDALDTAVTVLEERDYV